MPLWAGTGLPWRVGKQDGRSQIAMGVGACFAEAAGAAHYQNRKELQKL
jgi:hypothetical protein